MSWEQGAAARDETAGQSGDWPDSWASRGRLPADAVRATLVLFDRWRTRGSSSRTFNAELAMRGCASSQIVRREDRYDRASDGIQLRVGSVAAVNHAEDGVDQRIPSP